MATDHCCAARSSAIPRPMPLAPPVMSATRSAIVYPFRGLCSGSCNLPGLESGFEQLQCAGCSHGEGPVLFGFHIVFLVLCDDGLQVCDLIDVTYGGGESERFNTVSG